MGRQRLLQLVAAIVLIISGCSGKTFGENFAGGPTYLGDSKLGADGVATGSIAVDDNTERAFVLAKYRGIEGKSRKTLVSVDPARSTSRALADYTGMEDIRMAFPNDRILTMAEERGEEKLTLFDAARLNKKETRRIEASYDGTRLSSSQKFLAVSDLGQIHVIDTESLEHTEIPQSNVFTEASWTHNRDELITVHSSSSLDVQNDENGNGQKTPHIELQRRNFDGLDIEGDIDDEWLKNPDLKREVENVIWDISGSHTWISVSPDDKYAAIPVRETDVQTEHDYVTLLWNLKTGELNRIDRARGPVAFTPDGSAMIAFQKTSSESNASLLRIDTESLAVKKHPVPDISAPSYFVTPEGNRVVVASATGGADMVLYDLDQLEMTTVSSRLEESITRQLKHPVRYRDIDANFSERLEMIQRRQDLTTDKSAGTTQFENHELKLTEFVNRIGDGQLWIVDNGLHKLNYLEGTLKQINPGFTPKHINILPERDRLVLDSLNKPVMHFFDPETRQLEQTIDLKLPYR